jgi:tRNA pseudouridine38-40 synthase
VEGEVLRALLAKGYALESNVVSPHKLGLSSSSRVDKGVSSSAMVVSAKLLLRPDQLNDCSSVAREIAPLLPPSLRVFDAFRVKGSFRARRAAKFRRYEYLLPSVMMPPDWPPKRCDEVAARYEGRSNFHNFTEEASMLSRLGVNKRLKSKTPARLEKDGGAVAAGREGERQEEQAEEQEEEAAEDGDEDDGEDDGAEDGELEGGDDGDARPGTAAEMEAEAAAAEAAVEAASASADGADGESPALKRAMRAAQASLNRRVLSSRCVPVEIDGAPFHRFIVVGESFLYHQVRKMVAGVLAVAWGAWEPEMIDAALLAREKLRVALSPAEPLLLDFDASAFVDWRTQQPFFSPSSATLQSVRDFKQYELYPRVAAATLAPDFALELSAMRERVERTMRVEPERIASLREAVAAARKLREQRDQWRLVVRAEHAKRAEELEAQATARRADRAQRDAFYRQRAFARKRD